MTEALAGSQDPAARLLAVVVTHNRQAQLAQTVTRLLAERIDDLIVVDNASTDDTVAWLAAVGDPRLQVLRLVENSGGAGGFAEGIKLAMAQFSADWIVVMDDDARPEPGALDRFRAMDKAGLGAVAAAVYQTAGGICDMNRPSVNPFWHRDVFLRTLLGGGRMGFHLPDSAYSGADQVAIDAASFVGLFMSRTAIAATGLPDGRLFIYGDDVLYTLSMRRAGVELVFAPDLRFEHDFKTFDGANRAFKPLWKTYYHHRNLMLVYRFAAGWLFWPALLLILPKWLMKARYYGADRGLYLRLLTLAIRDALFGKLNRRHPEIVARATPQP
ncbi:MAG: glycosyltransferase [Candidatus Saccharibacteria bacterium]|nr:glycosyltransferase [Pseudorhodobacter sp.]